ncbi:DUF3795 domain-containing protein [Chloroflexota bacterium]
MKQDAYELVAICGIYCGTCPSYLAWQENDVEQLERRAQNHGISIEDVHCNGCRSDKVMLPCIECRFGFRKCAREHKVNWCFECTDFPCQRLRDFRDVHFEYGISHHEHLIEEQQYVKEHGIDSWIAKQEKAGHCPQCEKRLYWFTQTCPNCQTQIR